MKIKYFILISVILTFSGLITIALSNIFNYNNEKEDKIMEGDKKSFKNIDVNIKLRNVEFIISEDGEYGYEVYNKSYSTLIHEIKDSTLYITEKINYFFMFNYIIDLRSGMKNFDVKIYIPKGIEFDSVILKNTSGNISIKEFKSKTLDLTSTSGNVSISKINGGNFKTRHTSGKIDIENCNIENTFELNSTSGKITVTTNNIKNLKIKKSSGYLNIDDSRIGNAEINKTSGKLEIKNTNIGGFRLSNTSGDTVLKGTFTSKTDIKSTSGSINFSINEKKQNYDIYADLLSGNLYIDGVKQEHRKEKQYNVRLNSLEKLALHHKICINHL